MLNSFCIFGSLYKQASFCFFNMKKIIYLLLAFSLNGIGQNLVPNPDFEQYSFCPSNFSQISYCLFWSSFSESPDYFNTCSTNANISPPNCYPGFQFPHSGNSYVGICAFTTLFAQNSKELIGAQLLSNLSIGQKYFISLYVNLGGSYTANNTIASNKMGVKFSTVPYSELNPVPINNIAHFYCNDIITDTVKWTLIRGSFIADSAYSYIIIGNFFIDNLTDTMNLSLSNNKYSFYYLDDVCVSTDSLYCENWVGVNEQSVKKEEITIYPNPAYKQATLNLPATGIANITVYSIFGREIYSGSVPGKGGTVSGVIDVSTWAKGMYIVKVSSDEGIRTGKLVVE